MNKKADKGDEKYPRAKPEDLENFDPKSKACSMNCGPASDDPRSSAERKFLCTDCD